MSRLEAYVVDDDQGQLDNLAPQIERLLKGLGYAVQVTAILVDAENDFEGAKEKIERALKTRPDVFFFDNHLGKPKRLWSLGFQYIADAKPRYPDCIFVLMTRVEFTENEFGRMVPHPDVIIAKLRFEGNDKTYNEFFCSTFARLHRRAKVGHVTVAESLKESLAGLRSRGKRKVSLSAVELHSLVEQICYMGREGEENSLKLVSLALLEGDRGRSGAVVCAIDLSSSRPGFGVPGVMKISSRENAREELWNHRRYVTWMLPYTWRVDVIGSGETEHFGAVCYSFAHGGTHKPVSLNAMIRDGDKEHVRDVICAVFDPDRQTWYAERRKAGSDIGIYISTVRPYFLSQADRNMKADKVRALVSRICQRYGIRCLERQGLFIVELPGGEVSLYNVEERIFAENWRAPAEECICHGDMNASNILVRPGSADFAFIDFRHTGWHHRSRDFCSMEGSLRAWYPRAEEFRDFLAYYSREVECMSAESSVDGAGAWENFVTEKARLARSSNLDRDLVSVVRGLFLLNFDGSSYVEYCVAQLAHIWWLVCMDCWVESQLEIMVAELLALVRYLDSVSASRRDAFHIA